LAERDFAVVIGIDRYPPELRQLKGAVNDAREMYDWLLGTAHVPEKHAWLVVSDDTPGKPVLEQVHTAFSELRVHAEESDANGRLYFYFAGHGCSADRNHANLLMANATLKNLMFGMNAHEYEKQLRWHAWFREQLFFYDCCRTHDHAALGMPPSFVTAQPLPGSDSVLQLSHYAARWQQASREHPTEEQLKYRGLFSVALLDGLRGWAAEPDWNGDDVITAGSLRSYIKLRMRELTANTPIKQEPAILGELDDELIIAQVPQRKTTVRVIAPPTATEIMVNDHHKAVRTHDVVDGIATIELAPRIHKFAADGVERVLAVPTSPVPFELDLRNGG
jgi:uncharacterized caspase-like protein